jgi:hypothetical protein
MINLGYRRLILLAGIAATVFGGCGRSGPEIVTVKGTITYGGGAWPHGGTIYFTPVKPAEGLPKMSGFAQFDAEGHFQVESSSFSGLVPGRYGVAVECWRVAPTMIRPHPDGNASYVPPKYQSPVTSGLELEIRSGQGSADVHWDVPRK